MEVSNHVASFQIVQIGEDLTGKNPDKRIEDLTDGVINDGDKGLGDIRRDNDNDGGFVGENKEHVEFGFQRLTGGIGSGGVGAGVGDGGGSHGLVKSE